MSRTAQFTLLARYNEWMNNKLYEAAATLPAGELAAGRGAFFGSLQATLNHIAVADTIWLKRFAAHPRLAAVLPNPKRLHVVNPGPYVLRRQAQIERQMTALGGTAWLKVQLAR